MKTNILKLSLNIFIVAFCNKNKQSNSKSNNTNNSPTQNLYTFKKSIIILIITIFSLTSCLKKTECSGYVYSKHNLPLSNINIVLWDYKASKDLATSNIATTDVNGFYQFTFRTKRSHTYAINCKSDSGSANAQYLNSTKVNSINLKLE